MSSDDLLAAAAAQHGYFTTEQAAEHGISRRALTWRAQQGSAQQGSAQRIGHGLYRLPHWPPDPSDELYALQAFAPFVTFSHDTALTLLGLTDIIPSTIHFTIPETSRLRSRPGVTLHRSRHGAMIRPGAVPARVTHRCFGQVNFAWFTSPTTYCKSA